MADKKNEGKDVFDTALEYAPTIGGIALGALAGSRIGRRFARKGAESLSRTEGLRFIQNRRNALRGKKDARSKRELVELDRAEASWYKNYDSGAVRRGEIAEGGQRGAKIGAGIGGAVGYTAHSLAPRKKK